MTALSRRQAEVRDHILEGLSNEEIGTVMGVHPDTVKVYASKVYRKLGVKGSRGLAALTIAALKRRKPVTGDGFTRALRGTLGMEQASVVPGKEEEES